MTRISNVWCVILFSKKYNLRLYVTILELQLNKFCNLEISAIVLKEFESYYVIFEKNRWKKSFQRLQKGSPYNKDLHRSQVVYHLNKINRAKLILDITLKHLNFNWEK